MNDRSLGRTGGGEQDLGLGLSSRSFRDSTFCFLDGLKRLNITVFGPFIHTST